MRVVVTRPQVDAERTATALRARGHDVLVAPLMRVEPMTVNLSGKWSAVVVTSANAPAAIAECSNRNALIKLPVFAVGQRSAEAARQAGFTNVTSANGDVRALVRILVTQCSNTTAPLLYLAGEDRAADLIGDLSARGVAAEMRVVYRTTSVPFPPQLIAALKADEVDAVLHFSPRSADIYLAGAQVAGIAGPAFAVRHFCLSAQVAERFVAAGAGRISVAGRPEEAALIELLQASPA